MLNYIKGNNLILIESGQLSTYALDDKNIWEIGRPSQNSMPDIKLHSLMVSRKHGKFKNMDGIWFYLDNNSKNGTIYNHKCIEPGLNGRVRPVMLKDGDTFVFGGGKKETISGKTIWGLFTEKSFNSSWRTIDTRMYKKLTFTYGGKELTFIEPAKGTVINERDGIAIYMGDLTYLIGDMHISGE